LNDCNANWYDLKLGELKVCADDRAGAGALGGALVVSGQGALLGAHKMLHVALLLGRLHAPLLVGLLLATSACSCSCRRR
jgi:hypothetical protein